MLLQIYKVKEEKEKSVWSSLIFSISDIPVLKLALLLPRCWCCVVCPRAVWPKPTSTGTLVESSHFTPSVWPVTSTHPASSSCCHGSTCTTRVQGRQCGEQVGNTHPELINLSCCPTFLLHEAWQLSRNIFFCFTAGQGGFCIIIWVYCAF